MAIERPILIKDISENVWRRVEKCGYNRDLIMQAFKKHNYRLYDRFDEDTVRNGVIKSGISSDAVEYNSSDFIVTESGYMSFDTIYDYMGIIFNPDDLTRVTVYSRRQYDVDVCTFKKNYDAKSEEDSLRLVSSWDADFEDILAFGFVSLAVIIEDCYKERNIYGSKECREEVAKLKSENKVFSEIMSTLRNKGFLDKDIFACLEKSICK